MSIRSTPRTDFRRKPSLPDSRVSSHEMCWLLEDASRVRETSLKRAWKQPKTSRSSDKLKFHFATAMQPVMMPFLQMPASQNVNLKLKRMKNGGKQTKNQNSRTACILIGLFAFWPYTARGFLPAAGSEVQASAQLVNASYDRQFCISKW